MLTIDSVCDVDVVRVTVIAGHTAASSNQLEVFTAVDILPVCIKASPGDLVIRCINPYKYIKAVNRSDNKSLIPCLYFYGGSWAVCRGLLNSEASSNIVIDVELGSNHIDKPFGQSNRSSISDYIY